MIIDELIEKIIEKKNPTCVGLDPTLEIVPNFLKEKYINEYGETLEAVGNLFFEFNKNIIDATHDLIPAVKPQIAMYEKYGLEGLKAYFKTIDYAKEKNLYVIGDIKRGDIATTAKAYSEAHIGEVQIGNKKIRTSNADFITINPYMGADSVSPFLEECKSFDKGLFILVKTSNKSSGDVQDLKVNDEFVYEKVGALVESWGKDFMGKYGYTSVGAVVGATYKSQAETLRKLMPNTFFLIPGYGAQGGTAEDLSVCFDERGLGGIVNSSRGIIGAYKNDENFSDEEYFLSARKAVIDMKLDLGRCIKC